MNKDFIDILREIRGSGQPGVPYTNGIWYELMMADINGNPGIYGDILAKYGVILENSDNVKVILTNLELLKAVAENMPGIIDIASNPVRAALLEVVSEPLRQSILDAEANATSAALNAIEATTQAEIAIDKAEIATVKAESADLSESKAKKWADETTDTEVETGKFSAKHWAQKAADVVSGGVINDITPSTTQTYSSEKIDTILEAHTGDETNPHSVTKAQVGLSDVDNTADNIKEVLTATKLATARSINGVDFDGSSDINIECRKGTAIPSASTITIGTAGLGDILHITGTVPITSLGEATTAGTTRILIFDTNGGLLTNGTNLVLPDSANIVTNIDDTAEFIADTTTKWMLLRYTRAITPTAGLTLAQVQAVALSF